MRLGAEYDIRCSTLLGRRRMTLSVRLSRNDIPLLPPGIQRPNFLPSLVRPGIVHLGLGGFHRAHMARYTHDLMNLEPGSLEWGIIGVGLLPKDRLMRDALAPQDSLYTLTERQDDVESVTLIGSICDVIFAGESSRRALEAIASPSIRIVSLTVTENGYCLNSATKELDLSHPAIAYDLAHPAEPRSAIGIIVEAYRARQLAGLPAFTSLSCDNIQCNGRVLRDAVLLLAERRDPLLAAWIGTHACFPSTMVDRITPVTTADDIRHFEQRFAVHDRWPVFSELFRQWVIEDNFGLGRPAWESVGVQFVEEVAPYEIMKLRLLNASHLAIAGLGRLAGYTFIDEALSDAAIRAYMRTLMDRETGPTVPAVAGIDLPAYKEQLLRRFANSRIKDTVDRVNTDAPLNLLLDPIRDRLKQRADVRLLTLALASWMRRVRGEDEAGRPIQIVHPLASVLCSRAKEGGADPKPLLAITSLFGELIDSQPIVDSLGYWLSLLYTVGARRTLELARHELTF
jgi:mannitol 2-dehydrogenase